MLTRKLAEECIKVLFLCTKAQKHGQVSYNEIIYFKLKILENNQI